MESIQEAYEQKSMTESKLEGILEVLVQSTGRNIKAIHVSPIIDPIQGIGIDRVRIVFDDDLTDVDTGALEVDLDDLTNENLWTTCDDCHGEPHRGPEGRYIDECCQCGTRGVRPICYACEAPRLDETHPLCDKCHDIAEKERRKR